MKFDELRHDATIIQWFATRNIDYDHKDEKRSKTETWKTYLYAMQKYTEFIGKTPEELLDEAESEDELNKVMRKRKIANYIPKFRNFLRNGEKDENGNWIQKPLSEKSVVTQVNIVKSFYNAYDIALPNIREKQANTKKENNQKLTKKELREFLKGLSKRDRAIIFTATSSGMAMADIIDLKIGDIQDEDELGIITIKKERVKTKVEFVTFISPEANEAIKLYLEERNGFEKHRVFSNKDYLFIKKKIPNEYSQTHDDELRKLDRDGMLSLYHRLVKDTKFEVTEYGTFQRIRSHAMRKFFFSQLANAGASTLMIRLFTGKKIPEDEKQYFWENPEQAKNIYLQYLSEITIEKTYDVEFIQSYDLRKNQASIDLNAANTRANNEMIAYVFEIMKTSDKILTMYKNLFKFEKHFPNIEKQKNEKPDLFINGLTYLKNKYKEIEDLKSDRQKAENNLMQLKAKYQKDFEEINKRYNVEIDLDFHHLEHLERLKPDYKRDEEEYEKKVSESKYLNDS